MNYIFDDSVWEKDIICIYFLNKKAFSCIIVEMKKKEKKNITKLRFLLNLNYEELFIWNIC